jgi:hypothetical protein
MSHSELDRFGVITRVRERRLTQVEAARILVRIPVGRDRSFRFEVTEDSEFA